MEQGSIFGGHVKTTITRREIPRVIWKNYYNDKKYPSLIITGKNIQKAWTPAKEKKLHMSDSTLDSNNTRFL